MESNQSNFFSVHENKVTDLDVDMTVNIFLFLGSESDSADDGHVSEEEVTQTIIDEDGQEKTVTVMVQKPPKPKNGSLSSPTMGTTRTAKKTRNGRTKKNQDTKTKTAQERKTGSIQNTRKRVTRRTTERRRETKIEVVYMAVILCTARKMTRKGSVE